MGFAELVVSDAEQTWRTIIEPEGSIIGRGSSCDIILDNESVSRHHARIYQDPFGRWVIEDIGSQNGVWIEGNQVSTRVVVPGQKIHIDPFSLVLEDKDIQSILPESPNGASFPIIDKHLGEEIVAYQERETYELSTDLMTRLSELTEQLMNLSGPLELYSTLCSYLATTFGALVVVLRLNTDREGSNEETDILACRFGHRAVDAEVFKLFFPHLSKRVLSAVRSDAKPVMASSKSSSGQKMVLTVVDEHEPHVVFAARIDESQTMIDAIYIDMIEAKAPRGMFDFTVMVAKQVNLIQKKLFLLQLSKKEKALREANTKLKEKDRIKDQYVSRVTHDIKGHLSAIQSCLYIVSDKSFGPLSEKHEEYLARARRRGAQLQDFVLELLELTRMRLSGQIKRAPFALEPCLSKALTNVNQKAEEKSIRLTYTIDKTIDMIVGDTFSINEMVSNLLFNAVKYTPEGKTVHLEAKNCGEWVQIDISDTGIGIPENELVHVFDEFFRASNGKKFEQDGSGLGLSIVKHIIEGHRGKITVRSQESKGTTFSIHLPKGL